MAINVARRNTVLPQLRHHVNGTVICYIDTSLAAAADARLGPTHDKHDDQQPHGKVSTIDIELMCLWPPRNKGMATKTRGRRRARHGRLLLPRQTRVSAQRTTSMMTISLMVRYQPLTLN